MKTPASSFSSKGSRKKSVVTPRAKRSRVARSSKVLERVPVSLAIENEIETTPVLVSSTEEMLTSTIEAPASETAEEPIARVVTMETVEPNSSLATLTVETRRMMLWMGVSVTMFLVVFGWVASITPTLAVPSAPEAEALGKLNDQFTNMFVEVNQKLDSLSATDNVVPPTTTTSTESPALTTPSPALSPKEIEVMKAKVLGTETIEQTP